MRDIRKMFDVEDVTATVKQRQNSKNIVIVICRVERLHLVYDVLDVF